MARTMHQRMDATMVKIINCRANFFMIASHNTEKRHAAAAPASFFWSKNVIWVPFLCVILTYKDTQQAKILPGLWYGIKSAALLDEDDDEESLLSGCDL
jgi:hypothetical protein